MAIVYILRLNNGQCYMGSTINIEQRLIEHNSGKTKSIKYKLPVTLVFKQEFDSIKKARQIEYKLKRFKSKEIVERIISDGVIKID